MDVKQEPSVQRSGRTALAIALTVLAVAFAHGAAVRNDFVSFDDDVYIYRNEHVRAGLSLESVRWAFHTTQSVSYFHPITWLSLMADAEIFGVESSAYHAVNIALHALAAVLFFLFLSAATGRLWPSWLAATVWAVHPLTVEAVAWAAERKTVLSAVFGLGAVLAHVRYSRSPSRWRLALVLLLAVLGSLAKSPLVVLPVLLLIVDFWPLRRARGRVVSVVVEKLPLVAASAIVLAVAQYSARNFDTRTAAGLPQRALHALAVIPTYLGAAIWPSRLAVFHPFPAHTPPLAALFGGALVMVCSAATIKARHERPELLAGWAWFLVALAPHLGLVQSGLWPSWADRFAYLPLLGLATALAFGAADLANALRASRAPRVVCVVALIVPLVIATRRQVAVWRSSRVLLEHAMEVEPESSDMCWRLAAVNRAEGREEDAKRNLETTVRLDPAPPNARSAVSSPGALAEAERGLQDALRRDPDDVDALFNYATVLVGQGRAAEARPLFRRFLERAPPSYAWQRSVARNMVGR